MPATHHVLTPEPPPSQPQIDPDFDVEEPAEITLTRGRARRAKSFPDTLKQAEEFTGAPLYSRRIMRAILRGGDITYPRDDGTTATLTDGAKLLLMNLVDRVADHKWESGEPFAWPGNNTLAANQGRVVRCIQERLADLEEAGLMVRRYNRANGRLEMMGLDLRPLAAWLERVEAEIDAEEQQRIAVRQARRTEYLGNDSWDRESPCTQIYNSKYPHNNLSTEDGGTVNSEDNKAEGAKAPTSNHPGRCAASNAAPIGAKAHQGARGESRDWAFLDDLAAREWVDLFAEYSPTFRTNLEARCAPFGLLGATPADVAAVIDDIITTKLPELGRSTWSYGLRRHGMRAIAALLVAADKPGIEGRHKYLGGILKKASDDPTFDPLRGLRSLDKPARRRLN